MVERYKTAKELSEYLKKEVKKIEGVVVAVPWDISEKRYVFGMGEIEAKEDGISIDGKVEIESIDPKISKERKNYFEIPSARILYFEEKTDSETKKEAREIIKAEIVKDRKGKRS